MAKRSHLCCSFPFAWPDPELWLTQEVKEEALPVHEHPTTEEDDRPSSAPLLPPGTAAVALAGTFSVAILEVFVVKSHSV